MIKEILFSICMLLPEVCGIKNNIDIYPSKVTGSGYEAVVNKMGVLEKEYQGKIHYSVIVKLSVLNTSDREFIFKLSAIRFFDSKGQIVSVYRNIPAHVLDRELQVKPKDTMDLDLYLISYNLNEKIKFDGILK